MVPTVNLELCSGCGQCVAACPERLFTLENERFHKNAVLLSPERCTSCGHCVKVCPVSALIWRTS